MAAGSKCFDKLQGNQCEAVKLNCPYSCDACKSSTSTSKDTTKLTTPPPLSTTSQDWTSESRETTAPRTTSKGETIYSTFNIVSPY